jgi:hypothetical protein
MNQYNTNPEVLDGLDVPRERVERIAKGVAILESARNGRFGVPSTELAEDAYAKEAQRHMAATIQQNASKEITPTDDLLELARRQALAAHEQLEQIYDQEAA